MKLELKLFDKVLQELSLEPEREYFLGRSAECDIVLEEQTLSRKHLRIYQKADSKNWCIETLTEKSDFYFNGKELNHFELEGTCFFNLKNYVLSFKEDNTAQEREERSTENLKEEGGEDQAFSYLEKEEGLDSSSHEEGTQVIAKDHLLFCLRILIEGEFSDYINLNLGEKWVIGRSEDCDISINYDLLTRQHLEIEKKEGQFYVKDLGSTNKTYLNGKELIAKKSTLLNVNDEITVSDLNLLFEIRDTSYEKKIQKLPVLSEEEETEESLSEVIRPKLVLEDFVEEEQVSKKPLTKKIRLASLLLLILGAGAFVFFQDGQSKKQQASDQEADMKDKDLEHRVIYDMAQNNLRQGNFFECLSNIQELHQKLGGIGFYEDSKQIQNECQAGLEIMAQKKAEEEAERKRQEVEARVKEIEQECLSQYEKGLIKTLVELNDCARELFDLDPNNAIISQIRLDIESAELQRKLAEEKKSEYRKWLQGKRNLYYKAQRIDKTKYPLKAVAAYDVFLRAAKKVSPLKSLYQTAMEERNAIQNNYDSHLKSLRDSCSALVQNERFKEAYPSCREVLKFKNHDPFALSQIETLKQALTLELKPQYEKAQWHESFSRIEEAYALWLDILERDIEGGHYYQKALFQTEKYKGLDFKN